MTKGGFMLNKTKKASYIYNIKNILNIKNIINIIDINNIIILYILLIINISIFNIINEKNEMSSHLDQIVIKELHKDFIAQARFESTAARSDFRDKATLTDSELIAVLKSAGFKGQSLKEAWAIAKRESGGRPEAFNGNRSTGDQSYGLFQINMIGNLGPERMQKFNLSSYEDLFDPHRNAEIAYYMSQGGKNWKSWYGLTPRAQEFLLQYPND
jgi:hypothetical protein